MTELWLVRHGQTDWNLEGRYQGKKDVPLNATGWAQVEQVLKKLDGKKFDVIYSSHLTRALQTAKRLAEAFGLDVCVDERLSEISLGVWEGMLFADIQRLYPQEIKEREINPPHVRSPGGETVAEVAVRMVEAANEITQAHPNGRVLVTSHGLALSTLICLANGISLKKVFEVRPDNAQPVKIEWSLDEHFDPPVLLGAE
jgi:broad specificity phosphatase PhoE